MIWFGFRPCFYRHTLLGFTRFERGLKTNRFINLCCYFCPPPLTSPLPSRTGQSGVLVEASVLRSRCDPGKWCRSPAAAYRSTSVLPFARWHLSFFFFFIAVLTLTHTLYSLPPPLSPFFLFFFKFLFLLPLLSFSLSPLYPRLLLKGCGCRSWTPPPYFRPSGVRDRKREVCFSPSRTEACWTVYHSDLLSPHTI